MPRYNYYEETPEGSAFGSFGKGLAGGFTSGIERNLKLKDEERKRKQKMEDEGYEEISDVTAGAYGNETAGDVQSISEEYKDKLPFMTAYFEQNKHKFIK